MNKELNLALLFGYFLADMKGLDFDSYVYKYQTDEKFRNEVHNQKEYYKPVGVR